MCKYNYRIVTVISLGKCYTCHQKVASSRLTRGTVLQDTSPLFSTGSTQEEGLNLTKWHVGAQWLSGRVLDSRPRGRWSEPHGGHCVVVLEQDTFILA